MNIDRDVLFLSISSHGTDDPAIIVSNSQLPLQDLTDEDLADALRESGIKWRVIIISACYAGGFIERLSDPQTIVITAAAADRTSFGCSNDRDLTYFGEAFYRDALPTASSLRGAFDTAKAAIAARERLEHVTPSNPQAYFGEAMEERLASMNARQP
jgi:transposase InsO family protein